MSIGVVPTSAVGAHFELSGAAGWTRFVLNLALGRKRGLKISGSSLSSLVSAAAIHVPRDLETSHPYR
jgi:hypothetical protein